MEKIIHHTTCSGLDWLNAPPFLSVEGVLSFSEGESFKRNRYRSVRRFEAGGRYYFLKQFYHFPWKKQFSHVLMRKGSEAFLEWSSIHIVKNLGIPTLEAVAWGERFEWGLEKGGFLITKELPSKTRVEEFLKTLNRGNASLKQKIIDKIALYTRLLHENFYFHKDLYLGHFLIDAYSPENFEIYLIDLQRLQKHHFLAEHFRIKDLASLHFSIPENTLSRTFQLRFLKKYLRVDKLLKQHKRMICRILQKSKRIAKHTEKLLKKRHESDSTRK
jgi:heptose I phosphotransferase